MRPTQDLPFRPSDREVVPPGPPVFAPPTPPSFSATTTRSVVERTGPKRARFGTGLALGVALSGAAIGGFAVGHHDVTSVSPSPVTATAPASAIDGRPLSASTASSISDLVATARPSIVSIHQKISQQDGLGQTRTGEVAGTGFVLAADGYIVTNAHVVAEGTDTTVHFDDGTSIAATVVAADTSHDLAVLKVDRNGLVPLPVGSSDDLDIGDQLVAIGYALDLTGEPSVTTGILSAKDRSLTEPNGELLVNLLQTDTAINPGNSGGPLLNDRGEVIGINTAVAGQAQNIGFAIAISQAQDAITQLQSGVVPERAMLGIKSRPSTDAETPGAEVVEVVPNSAASKDGLEIGDIVTTIDEQQIDGPESLGTVIAQHQPGDAITITVSRHGRSTELAVTVGARTTESN